MTILTMANNDDARAIAKKIPNGPSSNVLDSSHANGTSNIQKQKKLMIVGVLVSPAPLNDWLITIP